MFCFFPLLSAWGAAGAQSSPRRALTLGAAFLATARAAMVVVVGRRVLGRTVGKRNGGEGKKQQSVPPLSFFSLQLQRQPRWPAHPHQGRQDALAVGPV